MAGLPRWKCWIDIKREHPSANKTWSALFKRIHCLSSRLANAKIKMSCLSCSRLNKGLSVSILSLWKHSMGTERHTHTHTHTHTPIQSSVSVVCQLTCLLHNRAPTPRPNAPDKSMHALLHMSYLYAAPKTGLVKNTTPVNYSLRNIPKQRGEWVRLHRNRAWG